MYDEYVTRTRKIVIDDLASARTAELEAIREVERAKETLRRVQAKREEFELPAEPLEQLAGPTVLTFAKTFGKRYGRVYTYAAMRTPHDGKWWITGREAGRGLTWPQLCEFITKDEGGLRRVALSTIMLRTAAVSIPDFPGKVELS